MSRRILSTLFILIACMGERAAASDSTTFIPPSVPAVKITGKLRLTGKLDDPRWQLAEPVWLRYEVTPGDNTPAPQQTAVRILYDDEQIYFGFDCRDSTPSAIRAHITDRDKPFNDDFMLVILDTYGDFQRSYEFCVNPYGVQGDLLRTGDNEDASFDAVWESAASIDSAGWKGEMAIPFKSLRFPAKDAQRWVVEFIRNYPRTSRVQTSWVKISRDNPCLICQSGIIEGLHNVQSAASSVDILPYALAQERGELSDESNSRSPFENGDLTGRIGGGLRYAPTADLAFEGVINPDFSQVESDATQISVNSNFALFYPEKRPFFLLGADIFQNQTRTFYSRTINNPLASTRVIGKSGSLAFAYLAAADRNTPFIVPGEETNDVVETGLKSISNVVRARYDFGGENSLGGMIITRNTGSIAHNYVGGIDWNYKFWGNQYFNGEVFFSGTKEVNDTSLLSDTRQFGSTGHDAAFNGEEYGGMAAQVSLQRNARTYSFNLQYMDRAPTFEAQDGFVPNNDLRTATLHQNLSFYPNSALVDQWSLSLNNGLHYNYDGVHKETWLVPNLYLQLKGQINVNVDYLAVNDELYHNVQFTHVNRIDVNVYSRPSTFLTLSLEGTFGKFIKRSDPVNVGRGHNISLSAEVSPTSQLEIDLSFARARLMSLAGDELFYDGYIVRATGIYQFNKEMFLRVIGQYDQFDKVFDVYPLFSYKLSAYTIFYAGSTYSLTNYGDPFGTRTTARQYFVKFQYLIRV